MNSVEKALYSETSCLAHTCFNSRNLRAHLVYFHLPKSEKLCEIWLKNAGRLDLLQMPLDVVKKNYFLCEEHFEDKWFRKVQFKGSLNYFLNPVPTIFVNNYKMFSSKVVEEEYENKKKREEFMRTLPDFDEMHVICDKFDDSVTDFDVKITNCKVPSDQYELKETEIEISTEINKENDIPIISNFENLNDCVVIKETIRQNFCRFCTEKLDGTGIYIFSDNKTSEKIKKMINLVLPQQVHENDGLPHHICFICIDKITHCYDFIKQFYSAEVIFRSPEFNDDLSPNNDEIILDSKDTLSEAEEKFFLTTIESDINYDTKEREENGSNSLTSNSFNENVSLSQDLELYKKSKHSTHALFKSRYKCLKCKVVFIKHKSFRSHMKSAHPVVKNYYNCADCNQVFTSKRLLNAHRKKFHRKHICYICNESFYYPVLLQRHLKVHDDGSSTCSICGKELKNPERRRIHEKLHSNANGHLCWVCGKTFNTITSLKSHSYCHFYPLECKICGKRVETLKGFKKHQEVHQERERKFQCAVCGKAFYLNSQLKQHAVSHSGVRPYVCDCGAAFNRLNNLNYHKKRHSPSKRIKSKTMPSDINSDTQRFTCPVCDKTIISELTFKYHMSKHTGNKKPFDCTFCGAAFSTAFTYRTHVRLHTGERPFVCKIDNCGSTFRSKHCLEQHQVTHTEERPFTCQICGVSFKRLYSLNMHKTTHSALRPFQCNICKRSFARKPDARIHVMRQHSKERSEVYDFLTEVHEDGVYEEDSSYVEECTVELYEPEEEIVL